MYPYSFGSVSAQGSGAVSGRLFFSLFLSREWEPKLNMPDSFESFVASRILHSSWDTEVKGVVPTRGNA